MRRFGSRVELSRLDWFDAGDYDHAYQGVVSAVEVSESGNILFGVQRSPELVLVDPIAASLVRRIGLADRQGNPRPVLSAFGPTGWAIDYDTVVRFDRQRGRSRRQSDSKPPQRGWRCSLVICGCRIARKCWSFLGRVLATC